VSTAFSAAMSVSAGPLRSDSDHSRPLEHNETCHKRCPTVLNPSAPLRSDAELSLAPPDDRPRFPVVPFSAPGHGTECGRAAVSQGSSAYSSTRVLPSVSPRSMATIACGAELIPR
jgi:hypothetical protein